MLADLSSSAPNTWRIACLRYFNPVGAHPSGRIVLKTELGIPNNLSLHHPGRCRPSRGSRSSVSDWPTHDGTGVRDYIHVMDLAEGHKARPRNAADQGHSIWSLAR